VTVSRVLVVGGGIAGAAVSLALRRRGAEVELVERESTGPLAGSRGGGAATGASAGMLAAQYEAPGPEPAFRLALRGRSLHREWIPRLESLSGRNLDLRRRGLLVANRTEEEQARARATAEWQRDAGLRATLLAPAEARELEPAATSDAISFLWLPDEAQLDAQRLAAALPRALRAAGVRLRLGVSARRVVESGGRVTGVRLADGRRLEAGRVVVAAGAWSGRLHGLPSRPPVRPVRGQILRFPAATEIPGRPVADHEGHYVVPRADSLLGGSTMEEAGFDADVSAEGRRRISEAAARLVPALRGAEPAEAWAGLRPVSRDDTPVLGPDPELAGLLYATGYGRNGIVLAPAGGELVAALALGDPPQIDPAPFSPSRFGEPG